MELARFSKNYLPILFNIYSTQAKDKNEERVHLAVYETCKAFLQISDKEVCVYTSIITWATDKID